MLTLRTLQENEYEHLLGPHIGGISFDPAAAAGDADFHTGSMPAELWGHFADPLGDAIGARPPLQQQQQQQQQHQQPLPVQQQQQPAPPLRGYAVSASVQGSADGFTKYVFRPLADGCPLTAPPVLAGPPDTGDDYISLSASSSGVVEYDAPAAPPPVLSSTSASPAASSSSDAASSSNFSPLIGNVNFSRTLAESMALERRKKRRSRKEEEQSTQPGTTVS